MKSGLWAFLAFIVAPPSVLIGYIVSRFPADQQGRAGAMFLGALIFLALALCATKIAGYICALKASLAQSYPKPRQDRPPRRRVTESRVRVRNSGQPPGRLRVGR